MDELAATHDWEVQERESSGESKPGPEDFDKPFVVLRWLYRNCNWPPREKAAYTALYLRRSEANPQPWPGLRTLAKEIGTNKDAAGEAVKALAALNALDIAPRASERGSNVYTLRPPWDAVQVAQRKPRGSGAVQKKCPEIQDTSRKPGQEASRNPGQGASRNTGHKEISNKQPSSRSQSIPSASRKRSGATPRFSQDAIELATALYKWLKENNALPGDRGFFAKQAGIAEHALLPVRSKDEWLACFEWAKTEPYWSTHLSSLRQLGQTVWPQYARRNQGAQRQAKRSPFAQGPRFDDPNSLFFRGG